MVELEDAMSSSDTDNYFTRHKDHAMLLDEDNSSPTRSSVASSAATARHSASSDSDCGSDGFRYSNKAPSRSAPNTRPVALPGMHSVTSDRWRFSAWVSQVRKPSKVGESGYER